MVEVHPARQRWLTCEIDLVVLVAIPVGPDWVGHDLDAGLFFVLAVMGVGVLGSLMAGWASANKFSLLGGLRTAAQLMAYELPFILAAASVAMAAGTLSLPGIVEAWEPWWLLWQAPALFVFFVAGLAELRDVTWIDLPTSHWPMWSRPRDVAREQSTSRERTRDFYRYRESFRKRVEAPGVEPGSGSDPRWPLRA